jgi:hypothetical protein
MHLAGLDAPKAAVIAKPAVAKAATATATTAVKKLLLWRRMGQP